MSFDSVPHNIFPLKQIYPILLIIYFLAESIILSAILVASAGITGSKSIEY